MCSGLPHYEDCVTGTYISWIFLTFMVQPPPSSFDGRKVRDGDNGGEECDGRPWCRSVSGGNLPSITPSFFNMRSRNSDLSFPVSILSDSVSQFGVFRILH
jgi:hypothetical protein